MVVLLAVHFVPNTVKRTVTLHIAGTKCRMVSDAPEAYLMELADLVNQRITSLGGKGNKLASPAQVLAMAALSLADDLITLDARQRTVQETARSALKRAIERIDQRLQTDERNPT